MVVNDFITFVLQRQSPESCSIYCSQ